MSALVLLPAAGLLVAWLGIIDIRASTGHWRMTDWFLHWVMRSSVRTAALNVEVPNLDDPAMLPGAAGHFETACAICHGSPAQQRSPAMLTMLPPPPDLDGVIGAWTDAQLFEIVKHGVRYTGMPAWPAMSRDDEVWQMVAFLRKLPSLSAEGYKVLSGGARRGDGKDLAGTIAYCNSCHGADRLTPETLMPSLSGQNHDYLLTALQSYRSGKRPSGIMQTAVAEIDAEVFDDLAAYYAAHSPAQGKGGGDDSGAVPTELTALVERGNSVRKIPACLGCHDGAANPAYPVLWNQSQAYLEAQLRLFAEGSRGGADQHHLMIEAARNLEQQDIKALSRYFASGRPK
ncbi:c-type cytochrome [Pararhizobium sp.]|uniref:c-type cytochrome n=1 Tax=Pararhizobium sp. TaxID=1977563 RepID=UPI0027158740|nr:c-type cytochrome [Pararhizobium sp.]MDO9418505.1 c-type cytochrome [Pararhizobium sp.]